MEMAKLPDLPVRRRVYPRAGAVGDHRPPGLRQPPRARAGEPGPWHPCMAARWAPLQKPSPWKQLQSERWVCFLHAKHALGVIYSAGGQSFCIQELDYHGLVLAPANRLFVFAQCLILFIRI